MKLLLNGENIPEPGIPESFKVLLKELQSLALDVESDRITTKSSFLKVQNMRLQTSRGS